MRRWLPLALSALLLGCGPAADPTPSGVPTPGLTVIVSPTSTARSAPTPTPEPTVPEVPAEALQVANTDGQGVYLRAEPRLDAERVRAWPEGARLDVVGPDASVDGATWRKVMDPVGNVGWVPAQYVAPLVVPTRTPGPAGPTPTPTAVERQQAYVERVLDTGLVEVRIGSAPYQVVYLGVDPVSQFEQGEAVADLVREAVERNRALVEGKMVELERDVTDVDASGRLLRYVFVEGIFVNAELVSHGYARAASAPPDTRYARQLAEAERAAREARRGLWGAPTPTPAATPTPGG
jgi:micrococcal nuclease